MSKLLGDVGRNTTGFDPAHDGDDVVVAFTGTVVHATRAGMTGRVRRSPFAWRSLRTIVEPTIPIASAPTISMSTTVHDNRGDAGVVRADEGVAERAPLRQQVHGGDAERDRDAGDGREHRRVAVPDDDQDRDRDADRGGDVAGPQHLGGHGVEAAAEVVGRMERQSECVEQGAVLQPPVLDRPRSSESDD